MHSQPGCNRVASSRQREDEEPSVVEEAPQEIEFDGHVKYASFVHLEEISFPRSVRTGT